MRWVWRIPYDAPVAIHRYKFFQPSDAARLSNLHIIARQVVEGIITGLHRSPHRGFSVEFSEHREYVPGDELRHLDWQAYARSDRYYIKLYEQETNLRAYVVLDTSGSMKFAQEPPAGGIGVATGHADSSTASFTKFDYARHLAACLAYLLAQQQDLAGLCGADDEVRVDLPAASSPAHLDRLFKALELLKPAHGTALPMHLHNLAERLPRRSMVILLSDLWLEEPGAAAETSTGRSPASTNGGPAWELSQALQHLRYRKHQCMVLHLIHPGELTLTDQAGIFSGQVTLEDLETRERIQIDPADLRTTYQKHVQDYLSSIRRACNNSSFEYHLIQTDRPYDKALVALLNRRS